MAAHGLPRLTDRRRQILVFIEAYDSRHGRSPTRQEIADHLGVVVGTLGDHLLALIGRGLLTREKNAARSLSLTAQGRAEVHVVEIIAPASCSSTDR